MSTPCQLGGDTGGARGAARPKEYDLVMLESSGLLEHLGYQVVPASNDRIFREPDSVRRGLRG